METVKYLNSNWNSSFKFRFKFDKQLICFHKAANGLFNEEIRYAREIVSLLPRLSNAMRQNFLFFNLFSIYVSLNLLRFDLFHLCFFEPVAFQPFFYLSFFNLLRFDLFLSMFFEPATFQPSFFSNVRVRACYKSWEQKLQCWTQMNVIAMHFNLLDFFSSFCYYTVQTFGLFTLQE